MLLREAAARAHAGLVGAGWVGSGWSQPQGVSLTGPPLRSGPPAPPAPPHFACDRTAWEANPTRLSAEDGAPATLRAVQRGGGGSPGQAG